MILRSLKVFANHTSNMSIVLNFFTGKGRIVDAQFIKHKNPMIRLLARFRKKFHGVHLLKS